MNQENVATVDRTGRCLCGAVSVRAKAMPTEIGACHCSMCRRWGGGPFVEAPCGTDVEFGGQDHISVYDSSEWAERGFCRECGTHLFYRLKPTGGHHLPMGLFDIDDELKMTLQVFVDERPGYYEFANDTEEMTGAEVFAKFGGDG